MCALLSVCLYCYVPISALAMASADDASWDRYFRSCYSPADGTTAAGHPEISAYLRGSSIEDYSEFHRKGRHSLASRQCDANCCVPMVPWDRNASSITSEDLVPRPTALSEGDLPQLSVRRTSIRIGEDDGR